MRSFSFRYCIPVLLWQLHERAARSICFIRRRGGVGQIGGKGGDGASLAGGNETVLLTLSSYNILDIRKHSNTVYMQTGIMMNNAGVFTVDVSG